MHIKLSPLTFKIANFYLNGGSYKKARSTFFISEATFYRHLQKLRKFFSSLCYTPIERSNHLKGD